MVDGLRSSNQLRRRVPIAWGSFPSTVVSAITSPRRCAESSLKRNHNSRNDNGKANKTHRIHPQKGTSAKARGTRKGRFRTTDCRILQGLPSSRETTRKPINLFPMDWPSKSESETAKYPNARQSPQGYDKNEHKRTPPKSSALAKRRAKRARRGPMDRRYLRSIPPHYTSPCFPSGHQIK